MNRQPNVFTQKDSWYHTPAGTLIHTWEQAQLDAVVADLLGVCAVQIGGRGLDALRENRMHHRIYMQDPQTENVLTPSKNDNDINQSQDPLSPLYGGKFPCIVRGNPHWLPFASQSVDLVVLPHVLEFATDPHQILREVDRILHPEGHALIVGFNPCSLMGIQRHWAHNTGTFPWHGHYLSPARLKDWLKILNLIPERGRFGCYRPPFGHHPWLRRLQPLEAIGDRWWPIMGSVYIYLATKRQQGATLVGRCAHRPFLPLPKTYPALGSAKTPHTTPATTSRTMQVTPD